MDTKTLDLRGLGDAERDAKINRAVAGIANWWPIEAAGFQWCDCPPYATSADAVLPLLEKAGNIVIVRDSSVWSVDINEERGSVETDDYDVVTIGTGDAPTLAQAACVSLLRANGIEVLT